MYYEFYIDQFFVAQLAAGILLSELAAAFSGNKLSWKRMLAVSGANAVIMTLAVAVGTSQLCPGEWQYRILAAGGILSWGLFVLNISKGHLTAVLFLAAALAGLQEAVVRITGVSMTFGMAAAALLLRAAVSIHRKKRLDRERTADVCLYWNKKRQQLSGIIDTGNLLQEPLTGKPVSIVEKEEITELLGKDWQLCRGFFLIPYHSIGKEKGWLQAVTMDKMEIRTAGRCVSVEHPVLAVYEGTLSAQKRYQIILHPQHVN